MVRAAERPAAVRAATGSEACVGGAGRGKPGAMGFLDRLLGREERDPNASARYDREPAGHARGGSPEDEQALERYRYLVRTAPPERIEEAHEEAFARLTPEQRRLALEQLTQQVPDERGAGDDPRSLARMATRAELRRPGTVERAFGRGGIGMGGMGMGGLGMGAGLLGSFATAFAGTLAAQALFNDLADGELLDGPDDGGDHGGDYGGADMADAGGGDVGGGDFGGGDFGGGDFGGDGGF
ncbi:MAG: hypothetical protein QOD44_4295 [Solirubrobacteraceae bacterium]|nr:hypothetical protein [Solirubrobacteraceae bacterium]